MGLIGSLVLRDDSETVVAECRKCGTTVERGAQTCPSCGSDEIAIYTIW